MLRKHIYVLMILLINLAPSVFAANNDTTTINYEVLPISEFSLSADPETMTITSLISGAGTSFASAVSDGVQSYSLTTNQESMKITAELNSNMPDGTQLHCAMEPASGWDDNQYAGQLSTTPVTLVSGDAVAQSGLNMIWQFLAWVNQSGIVAPAQKTVTFTLQAQ